MNGRIYLLLLLAACSPRLFAADTVHLHVTTNVVAITPAYINALVAEARTNNPGLRAASSRADAAALGVDSVRNWEDPTASLSRVVTSSRSFKTSEEGDLVYGIEQKLPIFSKPDYARKVAQAGAIKEQRNTEVQSQQLRRDIARAVYRAALWDRIVAIGRQDLEWVALMAATVEQRYAVNQASQVEVLKLQAERAKRADQLKTDDLMREHERVTLNRLLNRDLHAPWPELELPPLAPGAAYNQQLLNFAQSSEPKIRVLQAEIDQAMATTRETKRSRLPDIGVGVEARQYTGDGGLREGMFTVRMSLPWGNGSKYRNDLERDEAKVRAAKYDLAAQQLALQEEIHHQTVEIDSARREALLYQDDMIPRMEQTLVAAQTDWETNRGKLQDVLDARRMLLDARLSLARALSDEHQMIAELLLNCGVTDYSALPKETPMEPGGKP